MPIVVTCRCGQSFRAIDELAGKQVTCPACSRPLAIPHPRPTLDLGDVSALEQSVAADPLAGPSGPSMQSAMPAYSYRQPVQAKGMDRSVVIAMWIGGGAVGVVLLALVLTSLFGGSNDTRTGQLTTHPADPGRHYHEDNRFSIVPPEGWEADIDEENDVSFTSDQEGPDDEFREILLAMAEPIPRSVDLAWYVKQNHRSLLNETPTAKRVEERRGEINGLPAQRVVYDFVSNGIQFRSLCYYLIKGRRGYVLVGLCAAEDHDRHLTTFEQAIHTFVAE